MPNFRAARLAATLFTIGALGVSLALAADMKVTLTGANEVPPVTTAATGGGTITVSDDGMVSGNITTRGVQGTAAHIHLGAAGKNGPVVVPLTKDGEIRGQLK